MPQACQMARISNRKLSFALALTKPQYQNTQIAKLTKTFANFKTFENQAQPYLLYAAKESYRLLYTDFSITLHCVRKSSKTLAYKLLEFLR